MSLRAEKRRMEREKNKKTATFNFTKSDLENAVNEEVTKINNLIIKTIVHQYTCALALVLRDKLDFGSNRIIRTLKQVEDVFDLIDKGYYQVSDIEKVILEEMGIALKQSNERYTNE